MSDGPLVSCICPTYGRPPQYQHLVEEVIESFLRQDYPHKELIVLNDAADQELVCDVPGVVVVNKKTRAGSLGEKYNRAIELSQGELICSWDDDDISLPWRLSLSVEVLGEAEYWNPQHYWFYAGGKVHHEHSMGIAHNASIFRRDAWQKVGGYQPINGAQDQVMDAALKAACKCAQYWPALDEWAYIYRWGVSPIHLSGLGDRDAAYRDLKYQPGRFELRPHWRHDYVALCHDRIRFALSNPGPCNHSINYVSENWQ